MKEREQEVTNIIPSIKVCQHEYKLLNTEMKNKAIFSLMIYKKNSLGLFYKNKTFVKR